MLSTPEGAAGAGIAPAMAMAAQSFAQDYKMTTEIAPGVASPKVLEPSIGLLGPEDGVPSRWSADKNCDNLDRSRASLPYLLGSPIVNEVSMRNTLREYGPVNTTDIIREALVYPKTVEPTSNDNVVRSFVWRDTADGPLLVEIPFGALGLTDDNWIPFRSFLNAEGDPKPDVEQVEETLKVYRLGDAGNPTDMTDVNLSGVPSTFVAPQDYSFRNLLSQAIQEEPPTGSNPATLGPFASLSLEKGKPFAPDARMKKVLTDASNIGARTARTLGHSTRSQDGYFYADGNWRKSVFRFCKFKVSQGVASRNDATLFDFLVTGVTPTMVEEMVGEGAVYPWTALDADATPFDGGKTDRLRLPEDITGKRFRSAIVYDTQVRSMLRTGQRFRSVSSQNPHVKGKNDGSLDVYFGPEAPERMQGYRVQTTPGKGWFMILRLDGPLEPWFDQTRRCAEIAPGLDMSMAHDAPARRPGCACGLFGNA